ncbi:MAG TPA: diguanylate cyclase [Acidobacteriaceae bacterium]|nr:diguanylate cyclase [Acidobacteriaceae bacterium]
MPFFWAKSFPGRRRIVWLLIVFVATAICLGSIVAMVVYADAQDSIAAQYMVSRTQEARLNLVTSSEQLERVELSAELYLETGNPAHQRTAQEASVALSSLVRQLERLVQFNAQQQANAEHLEAATTRLARGVDGLTTHRISLAGDVVACRRILTLMQDQEGTLLEERGAEARRENVYGMVRRAVVIAIGAILILVLFAFLIRDAMRSGQFEERLSQTNAQLRSTVGRLEEQAFESRLLIDARDEVSLCLDVKQAEDCTVRYFAELIPGTSGCLSIINNSRHQMESVGTWGLVQGSAVFEGFAPESCCALRMGRARWRRPEHSEVHCTHFFGAPPERYLCLPVVAHGEMLGAVTIECESPQVAAMTETREESVISLAEMAAMAIAGLRLRERLERQSIRDGLTGLFNRSFMEVALERELHRAARQQKDLALMMVDIDHFKQFNDTFGHEAGDVVLREVAESLRIGVRSEDIVCRYGGEEFMVILPEITQNSALERAELLRRQVEGLALRYHGQPLRQVTISIGLALSTQNSEVAEDLVRCADRAMYAAKHRGRNRVMQADASILA